MQSGNGPWLSRSCLLDAWDELTDILPDDLRDGEKWRKSGIVKRVKMLVEGGE
jgi:hypothetical protein